MENYKVFMLNGELMVNGIAHVLVPLPQGICYGCVFEHKDDGIVCEDLPQSAKDVCITGGSIWIVKDIT